MRGPSLDSLDTAVGRLRAGGLVGFPTETVWGLAADARSPAAVETLRSWKGRGEGHPISVLVADAAGLEAEGFEVPDWARDWIQRFWPGPLTLVFKSTRPFAPGVSRKDGAVGVRCSSHPVAESLAQHVRECRIGPVTATSLNRTGEAPAVTRDESRRLCGEEPEAPWLFASGADAGGAEPTSVVDATGSEPVLLRAGGPLESEVESLLRAGSAA